MYIGNMVTASTTASVLRITWFSAAIGQHRTLDWSSTDDCRSGFNLNPAVDGAIFV
jgi:hypothetical protein